MAIQEIEVSNHGSGTTGFKREINEGAMGLILDTIQITQYTKPEESTVRELTANAVDSQREKEIAISILKGETTPEEHFIQREGAKYNDSNWNASYYSLEHLNEDKTDVELIYTKKEGVGYCDSFSVKDYGVGLGEDRLKGYFQLGFSTKRNSKDSLGAFGFGNKVALSTRCDYYTMISVHNGKRFKFNCYSYKIDSLIGKFNLDTNLENEFITINTAEGESKIYYEVTTEKNSTEIIVPTKRHHRQKYEQAVKSQLLYFNNVKFYIIEEDGYRSDKSDFKADVLYNSDKIIVSDNNQYSRPHIIITKGEGDTSTGVCYGFIDFGEMEMQQLYGNIGVKCPIRSVLRDDITGQETVLNEGVEVTPSRESVVWSEHTRNFITNRFKEVIEEANKIVEKELIEPDFLAWLNKVISATSNMMYGENRVLRELSRVVDKDALKPVFGNTGLKFNNPTILFFGLNARYHVKQYDKVKQKDVIKRFDLREWDNFDGMKVFWKEGPTLYKNDHYLYQLHGPFVTLEMMNEADMRKDGSYGTLSEETYKRKKDRFDIVVREVQASKHILDYDSVVVPAEMEASLEKDEVEATQNELSAADRRKALGQIALHVMCENSAHRKQSDTKPYTFKQFDTPLAEVLDFEGEILYGFLEDSEHLMLAGDLLRAQFKNTSSSCWGDDRKNDQYNNKSFKIIRLNKAHERHFKNNPRFVHVGDFFQTVTNYNG